MSRRRRLILAACATFAVIAVIFWLRPSGPRYAGATVEQWLERYDEMRNKGFYDAVRAVPPEKRRPVNSNELALAEAVFKVIGTNAVPFLASHITRDSSYSRMDLWRIKVRWRLPQLLKRFVTLPTSQASTAAYLLANHIKPPGELLVPLIEPALQTTNADQRVSALIALQGITSGHDLARPWLVRGLRDSDSRVQATAAGTLRWFGPHGKWAVSNLLEVTGSTNLDTLRAGLHGLNTLGSNSWPVLPRLKEMLERETDPQRRALIAHAITYISESTDGGDAR